MKISPLQKEKKKKKNLKKYIFSKLTCYVVILFYVAGLYCFKDTAEMNEIQIWTLSFFFRFINMLLNVQLKGTCYGSYDTIKDVM